MRRGAYPNKAALQRQQRLLLRFHLPPTSTPAQDLWYGRPLGFPLVQPPRGTPSLEHGGLASLRMASRSLPNHQHWSGPGSGRSQPCNTQNHGGRARWKVQPWGRGELRRLKVFLPPPGSSPAATSSTLAATLLKPAHAWPPPASPTHPPPPAMWQGHVLLVLVGTFLFFHTLRCWGLSHLRGFRHCLYSSSYTSTAASVDTSSSASPCAAPRVPPAA